MPAITNAKTACKAKARKTKPSPTSKTSANNRPNPPKLLDRFSKPPESQNTSALLGLAAELRLKIFRYLMKDEAPIIPYHQAVSRLFLTQEVFETYIDYLTRRVIEAAKTYQFSAQILACCQMMYREGIFVLYKEDQAVIRCTGSSLSYLITNILMGRICNALSRLGKVDVLWMGEASMCGLVGHETVNGILQHRELRTYREMDHVYPPVAAFDKFVVEIVIRKREQLFLCCRAVRCLLNGKKAILSIWKKSRWSESPVPKMWRNSCRILTCKEVAFTNHKEAQIKRARASITGDVIATDSSDTWLKARGIRARFRDLKTTSLAHVKQAYRLLTQAVLNCNAKLVAEHREEFVDAAEKATRRWLGEEMKQIERKKQEAQKIEVEMSDAIAELD